MSDHPTRGAVRRTWDSWKKAAQALGDLVGRLVLTLFYFIVVPIFALISRLFTDPLQMKSGHKNTFWLPRASKRETEDTLRRQF